MSMEKADKAWENYKLLAAMVLIFAMCGHNSVNIPEIF